MRVIPGKEPGGRLSEVYITTRIVGEASSVHLLDLSYVGGRHLRRSQKHFLPGLHLGDLIVEGDDLYGDSVEIRIPDNGTGPRPR
jgi:hypothetical protein